MIYYTIITISKEGRRSERLALALPRRSKRPLLQNFLAVHNTRPPEEAVRGAPEAATAPLRPPEPPPADVNQIEEKEEERNRNQVLRRRRQEKTYYSSLRGKIECVQREFPLLCVADDESTPTNKLLR